MREMLATGDFAPLLVPPVSWSPIFGLGRVHEFAKGHPDSPYAQRPTAEYLAM